MTTEADAPSLLGGATRDFRSSWSSLILTDIGFKIIAVIVLAPLTGLLFRGMLAASGSAVLSDADLLFFFLGPSGWFCFIVIGAIWLGIVALEQASLIAIACANDGQKHLRPLAALRFAAANAWPVIQITTRMVAFTLIALAPFLAVAAAVYFLLLTEYDINYYLKETPPAFMAALAVGGVLGAGLFALLLRLLTNWFFALPLILFEDVQPRDALRQSAQRIHGHRGTVLMWITGWFLATTLLSAMATGLVGLLGRFVIPDATSSLHLLTAMVGVVLLAWAASGLAVNLLSTTTFAVILFRLYRQLGCAAGDCKVPGDSAELPFSGTVFRITRTRVLFAGCVGALAALAVGAIALYSVRIDDDVQIMAHRGASQAAPENTMASIRRAIKDGADWVEIDVQETADGEVVVFHDSDFMKLAGRNLKIWDATMDDLGDIDIGSWYSPEFQDERVPTLAEVLDECRGKVGVNIELKYYGHDEQLEQRVADIVTSHEMDSQVMAMSLKIEGVRKMKAVRPDWQVGLLMSVAAGNVKNIDADFLAVNASSANQSLIRTAHDSNKQVYVWTINDAPTMSAMISRGVDGILTDKPALARSVLEQRAEMSAPQRLLLEIARMLGTAPQMGEP